MKRRDLSTNAAPEGNTDAASRIAQATIQERIRTAKEYKLSQQGGTERPVGSTTGAGAAVDRDNSDARNPEPDEYNKRLSQYGAEIAAKQEDILATALGDVKARETSLDSKIEVDQYMQQKQKQSAKGVPTSLHARVKSQKGGAQEDTFSRTGDRKGPLDSVTSEDMERRQAAVSGSEEKAASYLQEVIARGKSEAADLRPEMFTIFKDEETKARGVEFITKDKDYKPQQASSEYKPMVATWGMFPRPPDISKAYGGGKTYRPGEAIESAEQSKERKDRVAAAILEYRKKQGLFIDPEEEAKWEAEYAVGVGLMQNGSLEAAILQFNKVMKAVPARSKLGGEAQLQRAICLDSAGRNDEAYKLYMAADNLKANTMSYRVGAKGNKDWERYFTQLTGEWNSGYVDTGEGQTLSNVIAAAVIALPLLLVAVIVIPKLSLNAS